MSRIALATTALAGLLASPAAHACGGFFCNTGQPVVQNAERLAFAIDDEAQMTDAHVQIFYQGPADEFAWVVPVPSNPEIFLSSDQLFDVLAAQLAPQFNLRYKEEGNCTEPVRLSFGRNEMAMDLAASGTAPSGGNGVNVLQQGQVGPYDMVVIQGQSTQELLAWLVRSGYDLPPGTEPLLAPYVAGDAYFLGLKLAKDKDVGDIAPIGFRYDGVQPAIPIQLTAIAATPDMRLEAYVFASERVVPESYLHVKINEAAVDWWSGGTNYPDVITKAANEAGGHAFATDYAGSPESLRGQFYVPGRYDTDALRSATNFGSLIDDIQGQGWPATNALQGALLSCVEAPANVDPNDFLNCPDCFTWDQTSFDAEVCADQLEFGYVEPLKLAEDLLDHPWVSRMTSSLDAAEMTVDPVFVKNPDMGEVSNQYRADFVYECSGGKRRSKAMRRLDLEDGREILIPSERWMEENNTTPFEFIAGLGDINAAVIEQTGGSGKAKVLNDFSGKMKDQTDAHNDMVRDLMGCGGCSSTGSTGGWWLVALGALAATRRRTLS